MSLLKAHDDSNAAKTSSDRGVATGDAAKDGFTDVPYPKQLPVMVNSDSERTVDSIGALGNDGTNMDTFQMQPRLIDADETIPGSAETKKK